MFPLSVNLPRLLTSWLMAVKAALTRPRTEERLRVARTENNLICSLCWPELRREVVWSVCLC